MRESFYHFHRSDSLFVFFQYPASTIYISAVFQSCRSGVIQRRFKSGKNRQTSMEEIGIGKQRITFDLMHFLNCDWARPNRYLFTRFQWVSESIISLDEIFFWYIFFISSPIYFCNGYTGHQQKKTTVALSPLEIPTEVHWACQNSSTIRMSAYSWRTKPETGTTLRTSEKYKRYWWSTELEYFVNRWLRSAQSKPDKSDPIRSIIFVEVLRWS